jgi:tRNA(fMet)-specific endonuclease VapC
MDSLRYLLDTNICIYATEAISEPLKERLAQQRRGTLAISTISLAELAIGIEGDIADHEGLRAFLAAVPPVPFDHAAALAYGHVPFRRRSYDRLIAAHALALGVVLVTNNPTDFSDVPGLQVENWTV